MKTQLQVLAREQRAAPKRLDRAVYAPQRDRLTILKRRDPLYAPPTNQLVGNATGAGHVLFALAERKLVAAAEVEHVSDVEVCQLIVLLDAETGNRWSAIAKVVAAAIEQVTRVRPRL